MKYKTLFRKIIQRNKDNQGSTMVEVLVGFVILVAIVVECMTHIVSVSGTFVQKSRDMKVAVETMTQDMYKSDADYQKIDGVKISLVLDEEKTDITNQADTVEIALKHANLYRFYDTQADFCVYKLRYEE